MLKKPFFIKIIKNVKNVFCIYDTFLMMPAWFALVPIQQFIQFMSSCFAGAAPPYLWDSCILVSLVPGSRLPLISCPWTSDSVPSMLTTTSQFRSLVLT